MVGMGSVGNIFSGLSSYAGLLLGVGAIVGVGAIYHQIKKAGASEVEGYYLQQALADSQRNGEILQNSLALRENLLQEVSQRDTQREQDYKIIREQIDTYREDSSGKECPVNCILPELRIPTK